MTLKELEIGKTAIIKSVGGCGALRQHFLDMGVIPGAKVVVNKYAPMGDPMELTVQGYKLTLRLADADLIEVEKEDQTISEIEQNNDSHSQNLHKFFTYCSVLSPTKPIHTTTSFFSKPKFLILNKHPKASILLTSSYHLSFLSSIACVFPFSSPLTSANKQLIISSISSFASL